MIISMRVCRLEPEAPATLSIANERAHGQW